MGNGRSLGNSGVNLGGGSGGSVNLQQATDIWSYRHNPNNAPFVDSINNSVADINLDFPDVADSINQVDAVKLGGKDNNGTLGYWQPATGTLAINQNFTDIDKMNAVYGASVRSGFHPSMGNKNGVEAVTYHEMGHAITSNIMEKMGSSDFDGVAKTIVDNAYKANGGKGGTTKWAKQISGYAAKNNAECIAEAVADVYCNGNKAHANSKAIVAELKRY